MVTDWRSGARASIAGRKPSGGWSAAVSCWPSKGDRRWPAPQPSPSRTTKTSGSLRPSKGGPVTDDDGPLSFREFMAGVGAMAMGTTTYEWILDQEPADDTLAGWTWPPKVPCWVFTHRELPGVPGAQVEFTSAGIARNGDFVAAKFSVAP